ncbi:hypothetical protein [Saccharothrix xinjiangensis]|uniref:Uncharacterized protein n=1 Tax=Saccharothrix xinjiangensis TaxID=204798 RepID=A0ABV9Y8F2_9PSEU
MRGFVSSFERQVLRLGLAGLFDAGLSILSLGAVLSAVLGGPAVRSAAVVVAVLAVLATFATLISRRNHGEAERELHRRLIARYCGVIQDMTGGPLHIVKWDDVTVIDGAGGARETVRVRARVESTPAHFFRFRIGPGWAQPGKQRAAVACDVRTELVNGDPGPRCDVTKSWRSDGRLELLVHLPSPARLGAEARFRIDIRWPGMCEPLVVRRQPDDYVLHFARVADEVHYEIVLPEGEEAYLEPIGFDEGDDGYRVEVVAERAGRVHVVLTAHSVPAKHRFGVRLDLK